MFDRPKTVKGRIAKNRILESATHLFADHGFMTTNVAEICSEAEMAVGSFYKYFDNKQEALNYIIFELKSNLKKSFEGIKRASSLEDRVYQSFETFFTFVIENYKAYQTLRQSEFVYEDLAHDFYDSYQIILQKFLSMDNNSSFSHSHEIFLSSLIGIQMFFAMKHIIWEKENCIPGDIISELSHIVTKGVFNHNNYSLKKCDILKMKRKTSSRDKLLKAAEYIFGKQGYYTASVYEICRRAKFSVGSFYKHFASKEIAFYEVTRTLRRDLVSYVGNCCLKAENRVEIEVMALWAFFQFISKRKTGYRVMREAEFVDFSLAQEYYGRILKSYAENMQETSDQEAFKSKDYGTLAFSMMGIAHMLGMRFILWKKHKITKTLFRTIVEYLCNGIT